MAWGLKYKLEVYDRDDIIWSVYFYKLGYLDNIIILKGGDAPITFEFSGSSDELTDPLRVVNVNMSINVTNNFMYEDIVSPDQLSTFVEIYQRTDEIDSNSVPYWVGFVDPGNYEEPYDVPPYNANVTCVDGLLLLESIPYAETETANKITWYTGYKSASEILFDIFSKIGVGEFFEFINLYEYRMNNGVGDSPFDQFYINTDVFSLNEMDCRSVLEEILGCFNASILLKDGVFHIYKTTDLIYPVQYGRYFIAPDSKIPITFETPQFIYRKEFNTSALRQIPNSSLSTILPARKITITQDYAYKDSWLENWRLRGETYDSTEHTYKGWIMSPTWWHITPSDNPDGICMFPWGTPVGQQPDRDWARQEFGEHALPETAVVVFSYTYSFRNHTGAVRDIRMFVEIKTANNSHYAYLDDEKNKILKWSTSPRYIDFMEVDVPEGEGGGATFEAKATSLPAPGPYVITIYGPQYASSLPNFYMIFKDVVFRVTSDKLAILTRSKKDRRKVYSLGERLFPTRKWGKTPSYKDYKTLIDTRDVEEIVDKEHVVITGRDGADGTGGRILGDVTDTDITNVLEQFAGALAVSVSDRKQAARNFRINHSTAYFPVTIEDDGDLLTFIGGNFDFSLATQITNVSGDLGGVVSNVQSFLSGTDKIMDIYPSGNSGSLQIAITGEISAVGNLIFESTILNSCQEFVDNYGGIWAELGITLSYGTDALSIPYIRVRAHADFEITTVPIVPNLFASVSLIESFSSAQFRIDTIQLTGSSGSANIRVNNVTRLISTTNTFTYSEKWKRREWADNKAKPLIQLATEEIAHQYSRPKYMLDLKVLEEARDASGKRINQESSLNVLGSFTDEFKIGKGYTFLSDRNVWPKIKEVPGYYVDVIRLSGFNGVCEIGTAEEGREEVKWGTSATLLEVAQNAVLVHGDIWKANNRMDVGVLVSLGEVYLVCTSVVENYVFTLVATNVSGSLRGDIMSQVPGSSPFQNFVRYLNRDFDSYLYLADLNLSGASYQHLNIRYRVAQGDPALARIYYSTKNHGRSSEYMKDLTLIPDGKWHNIVVDMAELTVGDDDWVDSTITGIWFDVTDQGQAFLKVDLEWIGFPSVYAMNRGTFNVRTRQWQLDLIEIIK